MVNAKSKNEPTVIKKYANRRLYDTGRSSYVTLDDLCQMIKEGHEFVVCDAKSGEDLTRSVLTQIIVDQEGKGGQNLLPIGFLRQLIGFYGDNLSSLVPNYLEQSIHTFTKNQERFRDHLNKSMGGMFPGVPNFEEINKQNIAMFENAFRAFTPFSYHESAQSGKSDTSNKIDELKKNIDAMQKEIERLAKEA